MNIHTCVRLLLGNVKEIYTQFKRRVIKHKEFESWSLKSDRSFENNSFYYTLEFIVIVYFLFEFFYTIGKCIAAELEEEAAGNEI